MTQTVRVETPGCARVSCELSNDRGQWSLARTPGTVTVTTSHEPLKLSCRADGGDAGSAGLASSVAAPSGAGALAGGVVGGAAVGAAMGAAALSFIPVLGVIAVASGVAVGAVAGQTAEAQRQLIRYPELITLPMFCAAPAAPALPAGAALGLGIRGLLPEHALAAGTGARGGVLVTSVAAGGSAAAAGLRPGDILVAADGRDLLDAADLEERVLALLPGTPLVLRVWRDGRTLELALTRAAAP